MHIRPLDPASEAEIALVAERMRSTLEEVLGSGPGRSMYSLDWLRDRVRQHLDPSRAQVFLALEADQVLGHTVVRLEPDQGLFSTTWVQPEARRGGVAALLLDHGEHWLMAMGADTLATNTSSTNTPLLRLYEGRGYRVTTRAEEMVRLTRRVTRDERERRLALRAPGLAYGRTPMSQVVEGSGWFQLVTPGGPPGVNELLFGDLRGDAEAAIDAVCASFSDPFKWCVQPWTEPADLEARLAARGFEFWSARAMALETDATIEAGDIEVVPVTPERVEEAARVFHEGWGGELEEHRARLEAPGEVRYVLGLLEGEPVGGAGTHRQPGVGYLLGAVVLPRARRRGVYRALIAARLAALAAEGVPLAVTHAKESTSAPLLERVGFRTVFPYRIGQGPPR
jgi:ribosomal protein S18 acetylase RimI-like enzyme